MKPSHLLIVTLIALYVSGCGSASSNTVRNASARLTEDEKHRLYSAALAASESPLDNDTFKDVCRQIGIFDAHGKPNNQYMAFVSRHVNWHAQSDAQQFRNEINSKDKARDYIKKHLAAQ